ncbi:MAG: DUF418 domain-containing protein [Parvularculaceae bacterium]|nr:DUF418 domain-containing protein [Parvularculaceae bacterium]
MQNASGALPVAEQDRLLSLDVARGFALFGILIINSTGMGLYEEAGFNYNAGGGEGPLNFAAWLFMVAYGEGAMRGLFSLLFGGGLVLFLARLEDKGATNGGDIHGRRMLWLMLFGVINAIILMYPYDILLQYGIVGLLFFPFRKLGAPWLALIATLLLALMTLGALADLGSYSEERAEYETLTERRDAGEELNADEIETVEDFEDGRDSWQGTDEKKAEEAEELRNSDILAFMGRAAGEFGDFLTDADFWFYLMDVIMMVLIGMALARWGILFGQASAWVYWSMLLVGYGVGLGLGLWRAFDMWRFDFDLGALDIHWALYQPRRLFLAVGHFAMIHLIVQAGTFKALQGILAAVGRMAFTNYLMQSVFQVLIWYGPGLGLTQQLERYQVLLVVFAIWVFQGFFSVFWLRMFRFGPLEWVWRALTYVSLPPIRKNAA